MNRNVENYVYNNREKRFNLKYNNKVHNGGRIFSKYQRGNALYLPSKRVYQGESIMDIVRTGINFIKDNAENIKTLGSTVGEVGKVINTGVDSIKKIKELKEMNLKNRALENVIKKQEEEEKFNSTGKGFYFED